ncbi:MAG: tRNA uridine-5-carboxymethylaminomethyl(34) synthesis GTPase MnmE, partial [Bacteroidetes bacterium]
MKHQDDTIAAIITPIGEGGISVIRISGAQAIEIAENGFRGKQRLSDVASHTVHFGSYIGGEGELLDDVLATIFKQPHSYTGEDVVEISCHGSILVTQKILESIIQHGARIAEPGEFTKRAFLNGKMDLTQAEAVADIIRTNSDRSHKASLLQLKGRTSQAIKSIRDKLLNICSLVELELDFSEEGLEFINRSEIESRLVSVIGEIEKLINSYSQGRVIRDGVKVVIFGKPNVGKSSLMNALLEKERAIVTHISGTTRDTIEENIHINGILFRLVDTAGLRETNDLIE